MHVFFSCLVPIFLLANKIILMWCTIYTYLGHLRYILVQTNKHVQIASKQTPIIDISAINDIWLCSQQLTPKLGLLSANADQQFRHQNLLSYSGQSVSQSTWTSCKYLRISLAQHPALHWFTLTSDWMKIKTTGRSQRGRERLWYSEPLNCTLPGLSADTYST